MTPQWKKKWRRKSDKDKNMFFIVGTIAIVIAYGVGIFQFSYDDKLKVSKLLKRKENRMSKQKKPDARPVNTFGLKKKAKALQVQITDARKNKEKLTGSFVSIEDRNEVRGLRIALSSLANEAEVNILSMVDAGLVSTGGRQAPSARDLEAVTNNPYGRPLLKVRARSSYGALLNFFTSLERLKHKVVVIRYGIFVSERKIRGSKVGAAMLKANETQNLSLEVQFLLAL